LGPEIGPSFFVPAHPADNACGCVNSTSSLLDSGLPDFASQRFSHPEGVASALQICFSTSLNVPSANNNARKAEPAVGRNASRFRRMGWELAAEARSNLTEAIELVLETNRALLV
jgi:hypothetical protein